MVNNAASKARRRRCTGGRGRVDVSQRAIHHALIRQRLPARESRQIAKEVQRRNSRLPDLPPGHSHVLRGAVGVSPAVWTLFPFPMRYQMLCVSALSRMIRYRAKTSCNSSFVNPYRCTVLGAGREPRSMHRFSATLRLYIARRSGFCASHFVLSART